ncbi:hypothetical protein EV356DRAFT_515359 [Viridothelium virens]|uniref:Uncharacterized protein n=1 Tax=Viridothelium virens TaxID=1048519 RepID=A0A6A6HM99_VIRVR|nr:hypothetical protein EV356DRAFT_515359 [Viridothelium virens]
MATAGTCSSTRAAPTSSSPFSRLDTAVAVDPTANGAAASSKTSSTASDVESPSTSNPTALARFEFEPGRSKDGTKILMVEWEDDDKTRNIRGDWRISWEGKSTVLPASDSLSPSSDLHRLYFLLGPGATVPSLVTLTFKPKGDESKKPVVWTTNPLPAIFPPELGASALEAGKKGVLHTVWGKKRLSALQAEIDAESKNNVEGVALQMAIQEKEWIEQNFGITARPSISIPHAQDGLNQQQPTSPTSPRTPGGGRLAEKLRGLKLGTSGSALSPVSRSQEQPAQNPLSPEEADVAVGSFAAIKGNMAAKPPQRPVNMASQGPPASLLAQQRANGTGGGMGSLNAAAAGDASFDLPTGPSKRQDEDKEDDLFASPIGPRSPEMGKSPFSFKREDTMKYLERLKTDS